MGMVAGGSNKLWLNIELNNVWGNVIRTIRTNIGNILTPFETTRGSLVGNVLQNYCRKTRCCPSTSRTIPPTSGNKHDAFNHCFFASSCGAMFSRRGATAAAKATATPSGSEAKGRGAAASPDPQPGARGAGGGWWLIGYFEIFWGCAIFGESMRKPNRGKRIMNFGNSWFEQLWELNGPRNLVFELNTGPPKPLKWGVGWSQPADSCKKKDSWYSLIAGKECGQTRDTFDDFLHPGRMGLSIQPELVRWVRWVLFLTQLQRDEERSARSLKEKRRRSRDLVRIC